MYRNVSQKKICISLYELVESSLNKMPVHNMTMTINTGNVSNQKYYQNACHLKKIGHSDFIFDVHILGEYNVKYARARY